MTQERIDKLQNIGFEWDHNEALWQEQCAKLKAYKADHGHCNVPKGYKADKKLGNWVINQRTEYKDLQAGKSFAMTQERIGLLNKIGFEWDPNEAKWQEQYAKLKAFRDEHGHCNVPKGYKADKKLGNWVINQRTEYKDLQAGKRFVMTPERIGKLTEIGFEWRLVV